MFRAGLSNEQIAAGFGVGDLELIVQVRERFDEERQLDA
jgi:hypothetical protein